MKPICQIGWCQNYGLWLTVLVLVWSFLEVYWVLSWTYFLFGCNVWSWTGLFSFPLLSLGGLIETNFHANNVTRNRNNISVLHFSFLFLSFFTYFLHLRIREKRKKGWGDFWGLELKFHVVDRSFWLSKLVLVYFVLDVLLLNSVLTGMLLDLHISCFDI